MSVCERYSRFEDREKSTHSPSEDDRTVYVELQPGYGSDSCYNSTLVEILNSCFSWFFSPKSVCFHSFINQFLIDFLAPSPPPLYLSLNDSPVDHFSLVLWQ